MVALGIEGMLKELGCEVVGPFAAVAAGLTAARSADIGGALLDVKLRGDHVFPIADALTARNIPFVFCTGYGEAAPLLRDHAAVPRLEKPFDAARLAAALEQHFRSKHPLVETV